MTCYSGLDGFEDVLEVHCPKCGATRNQSCRSTLIAIGFHFVHKERVSYFRELSEACRAAVDSIHAL